MGWDWNVVGYQPSYYAHAEIRKIFRESIGPQGAISQDPLIEKETAGLIRLLQGFSGSPVGHLIT